RASASSWVFSSRERLRQISILRTPLRAAPIAILKRIFASRSWYLCSRRKAERAWRRGRFWYFIAVCTTWRGVRGEGGGGGGRGEEEEMGDDKEEDKEDDERGERKEERGGGREGGKERGGKKERDLGEDAAAEDAVPLEEALVRKESIEEEE